MVATKAQSNSQKMLRVTGVVISDMPNDPLSASANSGTILTVL